MSLVKKAKEANLKLAVAVLVSLGLVAPSVSAGYSLPTPVTSNVENGNYVTMMRKGFADFAILASESFGVFALIVMAVIFIWKFVQVNGQKETWGGLAITMGVGAVVLVIVYILLNQAAQYAGTGYAA